MGGAALRRPPVHRQPVPVDRAGAGVGFYYMGANGMMNTRMPRGKQHRYMVPESTLGDYSSPFPRWRGRCTCGWRGEWTSHAIAKAAAREHRIQAAVREEITKRD